MKTKTLTREEKIAQAYKDIKLLGDVGYDIDVPKNRQLHVGDKVQVGNLKDCVVIETSDDYKKIIIEYTKVDNNYGDPITTTGCIGGWTWFNVLHVNDSTERKFAVRRDRPIHFTNTDISGLVNSIFRRGLNDNPDYQRGYVWTEEDKVRYIKTVFEDRDLGKFVLVEDSTYDDYRLEALDGKQRLSALIGFMTSHFQYNGYYFHEMSNWDRTLFEGRMVQVATIDRNVYTRADLLKLFLEVNAAGVPQTEEHLDYVRSLLIEEESNG